MEIKGGERLRRKLEEMAVGLASGATLRVGFLENATYPDGKSVASVAAFNEFGTRRAPPRPFFRGMVKEKASGWPDAVATNLKVAGYNGKVAMRRVGAGIKGQLVQAINDFVAVPLAPATIAKKGSLKQLIDTANMINSADYEVE